MTQFHLLTLTEELGAYLPSAPVPKFRRSHNQQWLFTFSSLCTFLILCQLPLYGINMSSGTDPLHMIRMMTASSRNTFMELGVAPVVSASLIVQLLIGSNTIRYSNIQQDRKNRKYLEKVLAYIITIGESVTYVASGMYGNIGLFSGLCIVLQLLATTTAILLLDEAMSNGYGIGSVISLFITTKTCENVIWMIISPVTQNMGKGTEFEGIGIATAYMLASRLMHSHKNGPLVTIGYIFGRSHLPNLTNLAATVCLVIVATYLDDWRIDIPIHRKNSKNANSTLPIKLLYTSSTPIMLWSNLLSILQVGSRSLYQRYSENMFIRMLGTWSSDIRSNTPSSGVIYYISPPIAEFDPLQILTYTLVVMFVCATLAKSWLEISGSSVQSITKTLQEEGMILRGFRETSIRNVLRRYIPTAAKLGGMCVAILAVLADVTGVIGSGSGILVAVSTIRQYYEQIKRRKTQQFTKMHIT